MKERPILFKPEMVRALLNTRPDGSAIDPSRPTKTQTRRVVRLGRDGFIYRADAVQDDSGERDGWWIGDRFVGPVRWKPSIHMPKTARRLWLDVKDLRVDRVQGISDDDAKAEGMPPECTIRPRAWFRMIWDGINAKRGHSWFNNDWVWVYTFARSEAAHA